MFVFDSGKNDDEQAPLHVFCLKNENSTKNKETARDWIWGKKRQVDCFSMIFFNAKFAF